MKTIKLILVVFLVASLSGHVWANSACSVDPSCTDTNDDAICDGSNQNPASVKVKVYEARASLNSDCSNAVMIFKDDNAGYQNVVNGPSFGSGALPHGSYQCVMLRTNDEIKVAPTSTLSHCTAGQELTQDIAPADSPGHIYTTKDPAGNIITHHDGEDIVWMYFRIGGSSASDANCFDPAEGLKLTAPIVVTGDRDLTFAFNFDNKIGWDYHECNAGIQTCGVQAPSMSAR